VSEMQTNRIVGFIGLSTGDRERCGSFELPAEWRWQWWSRQRLPSPSHLVQPPLTSVENVLKKAIDVVQKSSFSGTTLPIQGYT
jgi:hypothetical protein